ncbi:MAG: hypothetical protein QXL14_02990 [Candidatus Aenigmatarchaeota archaeon]
MRSSVALALIIASLSSIAINLVFNLSGEDLDRRITDLYSQTYNRLADFCSQAYNWLNENFLNPPDFSLNFTGREIMVQGKGFSPNVNLSIYLGNITLNNCSTNESGEFNCSFPIPENISEGEFTFIVNDTMGKIKSKNISITPTPTPELTTPLSAQNSSKNILADYGVIIIVIISIILIIYYIKFRGRRGKMDELKPR